jgi:hypothetical protein
MTTRSINGLIINQTICRVPTAVGERGPNLLTEAELDHVAAAGGKGGVTGGDVRCRNPVCTQ